ncbi:MAG: hypothetical protein D9V47_04360 [Clostridia bacterium]|nr:MAG: hypothetical protein D9V47_04360 [Clostridia bacterium]
MSRRLAIVAIIILLIVGWGWWSRPEVQPAVNTALPALAGVFDQSTEVPFNTVYEFYHAVGENEWDKVAALTSPAMWQYLQRSGFVTDWEKRKRLDPSVHFVFFLVIEYGLDQEKGRAWAMGQTRWAATGAGLPNTVQTVYLQRFPDAWRIIKIDHHAAVQVADSFYQAINYAQWDQMRAMTDPGYWRRLELSGVLRSLQEERAASRTGVYVVFHVIDFAEAGNEAWVAGDAIWRPLTAYEKETPVTVHLVRRDGRWLVDRIVGHWEAAK